MSRLWFTVMFISLTIIAVCMFLVVGIELVLPSETRSIPARLIVGVFASVAAGYCWVKRRSLTS